MFIYETHLHTKEASACATSYAAEYVQFYKDQGFSGIFVTDHFFNGNCAVPRYKDNWERMINEFCLGYENAKRAGDAIGFPVFFGWESNYEGDEYLIYGLDKEWLLAHPDMLSWDRTTQFQKISEAGGLVVQAHPFRERSYIHTIRLNPETCHAMEAYNSGNPTIQNNNAELYCRQNNFFMTAGSDIHLVGSFSGEKLYGMEFDTPLIDEKDYVNRILNRQGQIHVPTSKRIAEGEIKATLPVIVNKRGYS